MFTIRPIRKGLNVLLARLHIMKWGQTSNGRWRLSSSGSVTLHGRSAGGFSRAGQAMTSCRLQSNYSSTVTLHGRPVRLRPVRATPCLFRITSYTLRLTKNKLTLLIQFYILGILSFSTNQFPKGVGHLSKQRLFIPDLLYSTKR